MTEEGGNTNLTTNEGEPFQWTMATIAWAILIFCIAGKSCCLLRENNLFHSNSIRRAHFLI